MLLLRVILPVLAVALAAAPARAGIVNVQSILTTEADEGLSGAFAGSADWRTGNFRLLVASASPVARYKRGQHLVVGIVRGELGRGAEGILTKTFAHLRYRYDLGSRVLAEVFTQHEYDEFRNLNTRALLGAGPRINLLEGDGHTLGWGVAYMLEYERLAGDAGAGPDLAHRVSTYLVGSYELDDRVQLVETVYAQPRLGDLDDYRLLNESQMVFKITGALSMATSVIVSFDSSPPPGVEDLDTQLTSSLTYSF